MRNQRSATRRKVHEAAAVHPASPPTPQLTTGFAPGAPDLGHSQVVHDSWREYFRGLPAEARLLDIAAGIGAVALVAQEVSSDRDSHFEVHSLDLASTFNAEPLSLDGICLHARRYDSSTPFEDGYFDAISMQWAPPDDGTTASGLAELRRILRRGGRARLMFHALGGAAHEQCLGRVRAVDTLLDEVRLLEHARHMFEVVFTQETTLKRGVVRSAMLALQSQQEYANAARWATYLMRDTPNPKGGEQILQLIADCWERRQGMTLADVQAHLDRLEADLRAAQTRMRAACALAVDETRAYRIGKLFKASGFQKVKVKPFRAVDHALIGWDLQAV